MSGLGNVTQTQAVAKPGSGAATITTSASYAATCTNVVICNLPTSTTDARGNVTDYEYDATHGGVTSVTAPAPSSGAARPETRYAYTQLNNVYQLTAVSACASGVAPACVGTTAESRTVASYDTQGNVTSVQQRDGTGGLSAVTAMTYTAMGDVETVDGPLSGADDTTRIRYNAAREVIGTITADPDGTGPLKHRATRNIISASTGLETRVDAGTVDSQSDTDWLNMAVHQSVEADYDAHARPIVQRLVAGSTTYSLTQTSYDALGRPECTAQRMNPAVFTSLPSSACSLGTEGTFGPDRIVRAIYDELGRVREQRSAVGTLEEAVEAATTFTANGQAETLTDGEGNRTTYEYDGHDRPVKTRYPSPTTDGVSSTTDYEQLTYDAGSNVTSVRLRDGQVIGLGYDALNRLTSRDRPNNASLEFDESYGYDQLGRMVSATGYQGNHQMTFAYDGLGRPTSQADNWYGTTSAEYDLAGRRTRLVHPFGQGNHTFRYLVTGEMKSVHKETVELATYGHDQMGRRSSLGRNNGTATSYGYDAVGRLSSLVHNFAGTASDVTFGYTYNPAGQIASRTADNDIYSYTGVANQNVTDTHNGLNQIVTAGLAAFTHDGRGNSTSNGSSSYTYTADNKLATGGGSNFYYDMVGRLVHSSAAARDFLYDIGSGRMIGEKTAHGGAVQLVYVPGAGVDETLAVWDPNVNATDQLHTDERGSVIAVSNAAGNAYAINRYDDYGNPQGWGGTGTQSGRFGYTGQAWMPELGMYNYKARIYNPRLEGGGGRFMQTDPIGYGDGMNLYGYVGGDPVNRVDPPGLEEEIVVTGRRPERDSACPSAWTCYSPRDALRFDDIEIDFGSSEPAIVVTGTRIKRPAAAKVDRSRPRPRSTPRPPASREDAERIERERRQRRCRGGVAMVGAGIAFSATMTEGGSFLAHFGPRAIALTGPIGLLIGTVTSIAVYHYLYNNDEEVRNICTGNR